MGEGQHRPPRVQFYLGSDEAKQAMADLKAHYGTDSASRVALQTLIDHAASLREPKPAEKRVTLSKRVY